MTTPSPEERARALFDEKQYVWPRQGGYADEGSPYLDETAITDIAAAIREAVGSEREACANVADSYMQQELDEYGRLGPEKPPLFAARIRNAIRSRSEKP